jgi:hypothetical protein
MSSLDKIEVSGKPQPARVLLYGPAGVGKTTAASRAFKPAILGTEDGTGLLSVPCFPIAKSYDDVLDSLKALMQEDHEFRTLVIDSIDGVEHLIDKSVCDRHGKEFMSDFAYYKGNIESFGRVESLLHDLDDLRSSRGMQIILISHSIRVTVEDPTIGAFDRMEPNLYKKAVPLIVAWADIVGHMDFEKVITDKGDKTSSRTVRTTRKSASKSRVIHFQDDGSFIAKNRRGLPDSLNVEFEDGWSEVESAMKEAQNPTKGKGKSK